MTRGVSAAEMTNDFNERRVTYRGIEYVLRELSMAEYDKTVAAATTKDEAGVEDFDGNAHIKILMAKSLVSPKLSSDELSAKPSRLVRSLQVQAGQLHWDPEPDETKKDKDDKDEGAETAGEVTAPSSE